MSQTFCLRARLLAAAALSTIIVLGSAQDVGGPPRDRADGPPPFRPDGPRGPGGPGGFGGPGGPGGPQAERKLRKQFDADKNKMLDQAERKAAREFIAANPAPRRGPGGPGGPGGLGGPGGPSGPRGPGGRGPRPENLEPAQPGAKLAPGDVKHFGDTPLYDAKTIRTFFLEFESADWEKELADFNNTDVEVPAKLTVDGKTYENVGVHFRGASSFFMTPADRKRSLNLSMDFVKEDQNLNGYRTLNLLNSHTDPSFLRTVLYYQVAADYIPTPKANFVRVVINGESWGIYVNAQQFNKEFANDNFGTTKGARWKVPGSPRGRGGLEYLGDSHAEYAGIYEIKSKDEPKSWNALVNLCKVLNQTSANELVKALEPILDIDGALKFLAIENALINGDGYWVRASDYNIYMDEKGKFHVVPHDANETFRPAGGPGRPREGNPIELPPLTGLEDADKPLLSKLLAVPELRQKYLSYVRDIAERWLAWDKLGPIAQAHHNLIAEDVKKDTRKLSSEEGFAKSLTAAAPAPQDEPRQGGFRGPGGPVPSLKAFTDQRRAYLLSLPEVKNAPALKRQAK